MSTPSMPCSTSRSPPASAATLPPRKHAERIRRRLATAMGQVGGKLQSLGLTYWQEPREGLFLWMRLPEGRDAAELARRALRHNIVLAPGNVFSPAQSWPDYLRF